MLCSQILKILSLYLVSYNHIQKTFIIYIIGAELLAVFREIYGLKVSISLAIKNQFSVIFSEKCR